MNHKYEKYKESDIKWAGEIPSNWQVSKIKFVTNNEDGKREPISGEFRYDKRGDYPYYGATGVVDYINDYKYEGKYLLIGEDGAPFFTPNKNVAFIAEGKFWVNNHAHVLSNKSEIDLDFLCYLLNCVDYREYISGSTRDKLTKTDLSDIKIILPQIDEQIKIAQYIDIQTATIDQLIQLKKKLIELLKEKRQSIINEAVTKGLNPKAKMKDSGIEWLGEVPEHWEIKKIKHIKSKEPNAFVDGPFGSNLKSEHFIENGDVYVIESGFITSGIFEQKKDFKTISLEHYHTISRSTCKEGDIIIAKIGANYGMSGILPNLDKPAVVSGNSLKLTVDTQNNETQFIHYYLLNLKQTGSLEVIVNATAQPALSLGTLNDVGIAIPRKAEQIEISLFIQKSNIQINELSEMLDLQIEKMKEYRQSIISEAVTGKIDVRDWQPNKQQVA